MAMPTNNVVLQQSPTAMTMLPENQSMRFENDFRLADQSMSEAEFYCPNETMPFCAPPTYNNLSPPAPAPSPTPTPAPAPAFYCPNYSYEIMTFCAPSTYNNLSPLALAPTPMESTGLLSDVINFCSNNTRHVVAANNGRVSQSSKTRIIWTIDEHK